MELSDEDIEDVYVPEDRSRVEVEATCTEIHYNKDDIIDMARWLGMTVVDEGIV